MNEIAIAVNLVLGTAYLGAGIITAIEMKRDWGTFGFSHFGLAMVCMAFTCGPHHLDHAIHLRIDGGGQAIDAATVAFGLPFGVVWLWLRTEAFLGGPGDRFVPDSPKILLRRTRAGVGLYLGLFAALLSGALTSDTLRVAPIVGVNLLLIGLYFAIGTFVGRTQLANHRQLLGWSSSGVCLAFLFLTCSLMHGASAALVTAGAYESDAHSMVIDGLSVPAAMYFLLVVRALFHDSIRDWNSGPRSVGSQAVPTTDPVRIGQGR